jgi:uncharacterized protein
VRYHQIPPDLFAALAAGGGGKDAITILVQAQHSKHTLLLHGVVTSAAAVCHPDADVARRGHDLLAQAQRHDPDAVADVVRHPSVGAWAYRTMTGLRGGTVMAGATPSGVAAVAAAAAIRAGVQVELEIPVTGGIVMLPSLGAAGPFDGESALVRTRPDGTEVLCDHVIVRIPADYRTSATGWRPLPVLLTARSPSGTPGDSASFELMADDMDPFRMPAAPHLARDADLTQWCRVFQAAWTLLESRYPAVAAELAALVRVIVPLAKPAEGQVSSSSPETFGAIALSDPADSVMLAETLIHEVQHVKLSALLDMTRLTQPDDGSRFYAPWRNDPRPASGLLQGTYAYLGVAGFWRRQRELDDRMQPHALFARWREAAALGAATLLSSAQLTIAGESFVRDMMATLTDWQDERVPERARRFADEENGRHRAQWQAEHGFIPVGPSGPAAVHR